MADKKKPTIIKPNSIKRYVKDVLNFKIRTKATENLILDLENLTKTILQNAKKSAQEGRKSIIMPKDISDVSQKKLGGNFLNSEEIFNQVKNLDAFEIGKLINLIQAYLKKEKDSKI
jgi:histone H3/H4